jgi:hypothetical protein
MKMATGKLLFLFAAEIGGLISCACCNEMAFPAIDIGRW